MHIETPILTVENLSKSYGNINAINNISMEIFEGTVTALVGDNGAGKSTLIKILSGVIEPDQGIITISGQQLKKLSAKKARSFGISTVYQDLSLGDTMNVVENIFLGEEITKFGLLNKNKMMDITKNIITNLNVNIPDLTTKVGELSGGQRQGVAVSRLINNGGKIFIFDEPTAAMGISESNSVLRLIRELRNKGYAIILVSHNIPQVIDVSDWVYILKNGTISKRYKTSNVDIESLTKAITTGDLIR